jgi:hypothetical protein
VLTGTGNAQIFYTESITSVETMVFQNNAANLLTSARVTGASGGTFDFASTQNVATPGQAILIGGEFNTSPTAITSGFSSPLQLDTNGNLLVNIKASIAQAVTQSGTWTDRIVGNAGNNLDFVGQNASGTVNAQLIGGQFNTSPTAITSGNFSPLQLDASGNTLVSIKASITQPCAGEVASGSADSGNPQKIGGVGRTTNPTAVTDGQRVNAIFDKLGKQIVVGAIRDLKAVQKTTITSSTSETTIVTAIASTFCDLYSLIIANTSATACNVTIKDATAGTTRMILACPAGDTRGFTVPVDSAIPQATVNTNWTATCSASVASIEITALYVKNT